MSYLLNFCDCIFRCSFGRGGNG